VVDCALDEPLGATELYAFAQRASSGGSAAGTAAAIGGDVVQTAPSSGRAAAE